MQHNVIAATFIFLQLLNKSFATVGIAPMALPQFEYH